jgi:hypothetical protein
MQKQIWLITAGNKIHCRRCQATSKRTRLQCGAPAMSGKNVCRFHGGRSTGPRTEAGKARIAAAMTVHCNSTRQARAELSEELMQLAILEELALSMGMITAGSRGRRPGYRKE